MSTVELSIVLPCLNEARTVVDCVSAAKRYLAANKVSGEVIVADNGSDDGSQGLAVDAGARLVTVHYRGYGAALQGGIAAAQGRFVVMADADQSYDLASLNAFLEKLREGYDLVMGNRFKGGIRSGAMPLLHRYLGNPALSFIGKLFFKSTVGDFHCGLRGFRKDAIVNLNLRANGMEFASEMVVKAALAKLRITEVPTTLSKDGRNRAPHLRTWRDGWRHLRFLLLFSPRWLFLYPGAMLLTLGTLLQVVLLHGAFVIGSIGLDIHTMLYAAAMSIIGLQMLWFALFSKVYGISAGFLPRDKRIEAMLRVVTLERGAITGCLLLIFGVGLSVTALSSWAAEHYGALEPREIMRIAIPAVTSIIAGSEIILASFFLSVLQIDRQTSICGENSNANS